MLPRIPMLLAVVLAGCVERPPDTSAPSTPDAGAVSDDLGAANSTDTDARGASDSTMTEDVGLPDFGEVPTVVFQQRVSPTASYAGTEDTMLDDGSPSTTEADTTDLQADTGQAILVQWDISSIPREAEVVAARIELNANSDSSSGMFDVLIVRASWSESTATWDERESGQPWDGEGCSAPTDRDETPIGTVSHSEPYEEMVVSNDRLVTAVQGWVADPATNHGITIQKHDVTDIDGLHISSSEHPESNYRPRLVVTHRP